jgi:hypothetical protein
VRPRNKSIHQPRLEDDELKISKSFPWQQHHERSGKSPFSRTHRITDRPKPGLRLLIVHAQWRVSTPSTSNTGLTCINQHPPIDPE